MADRRQLLSALSIVLMVLALPLLIYGAISVKSETTDMLQWLPGEQEQRETYDQFVSRFGHDDVVLVSWPNCTLDDDRLQRFEESLQQATDPDADSASPLIRRISTGPALLDRLESEPVDLSRERALGRLRGLFVGPDGVTTCTVVEVTPAGNLNPHAVVQLIVETAKKQCGLSRDELRMGGGIYETVLIDEESQRTFRERVGLSGLIGLIVAMICLRSLGQTAVVIVAGVYCSLFSTAMLSYCGVALNALMLVLPTLIYVLIISSAVHLVNYYRDALREDGQAGAVGRAMAVGWLPCTLATITTAIGMLSLVTSQIEPVRSFGVYSAVCLTISLLILMGILPAILILAPTKPPIDRARPHGRGGAVSEWIARFIIRRHGVFSIGSALLLLLLGMGIPMSTSSVRVEGMFKPDNELVRNYHWLEKNIGSLAGLEVLVTFDSQIEWNMVQRLMLIERLERRLREVDGIDNTISATTFAPPVPRGRSARATIRRAVFNRKLEGQRQALIDDRMLAEDDSGEQWRITARLPALQDIDYTALTSRVNHSVQVVMREQALQGEPIDVQLTGAILIMDYARRQLLRDLAVSFVLTFVVICPLMMIILRSLGAGVLVMLPNVAPAVSIFGGMGWFGVPVDVGAVLTASVALGVAVDDTLHFLTWFGRGLRAGQSRSDAICMAYRRCAVAMVQTTLICGLGLLVFATGDFVPASRFAIIMFCLLITALVGDLILLPAMLAGPVGWFFVRQFTTVDSARPDRQRSHTVESAKLSSAPEDRIQ